MIAGTVAAFFAMMVLILAVTKPPEAGRGLSVRGLLRALRLLPRLPPPSGSGGAGGPSPGASRLYATLKLTLEGELANFTAEAEMDLLERLAFFGGVASDCLVVVSRMAGSIILEVAVMRSADVEATADTAANAVVSRARSKRRRIWESHSSEAAEEAEAAASAAEAVAAAKAVMEAESTALETLVDRVVRASSHELSKALGRTVKAAEVITPPQGDEDGEGGEGDEGDEGGASPGSSSTQQRRRRQSKEDAEATAAAAIAATEPVMVEPQTAEEMVAQLTHELYAARRDAARAERLAGELQRRNETLRYEMEHEAVRSPYGGGRGSPGERNGGGASASESSPNGRLALLAKTPAGAVGGGRSPPSTTTLVGLRGGSPGRGALDDADGADVSRAIFSASQLLDRANQQKVDAERYALQLERQLDGIRLAQEASADRLRAAVEAEAELADAKERVTGQRELFEQISDALRAATSTFVLSNASADWSADVADAYPADADVAHLLRSGASTGTHTHGTASPLSTDSDSARAARHAFGWVEHGSSPSRKARRPPALESPGKSPSKLPGRQHSPGLRWRNKSHPASPSAGLLGELHPSPLAGTLRSPQPQQPAQEQEARSDASPPPPLQPAALDLLYRKPDPPAPTPPQGEGQHAQSQGRSDLATAAASSQGKLLEEASSGLADSDAVAAARAARKVAKRSRQQRSHPGKLQRQPPRALSPPRSVQHLPSGQQHSEHSPPFVGHGEDDHHRRRQHRHRRHSSPQPPPPAAPPYDLKAALPPQPLRVVQPPSADHPSYEVLFEGQARVALYTYNDILIRRDTPGLPALDAATVNGMLRCYLAIDGWTPMARSLDELPPRLVVYGESSPHYHTLRLRPSPAEANTPAEALANSLLLGNESHLPGAAHASSMSYLLPLTAEESMISSCDAYRLDEGEALRRILILRERPFGARDIVTALPPLNTSIPGNSGSLGWDDELAA